MTRRRPDRRRAFTLLELLVTIGIIALLASLVIVALGGVSDGANRAESTNALRTMMAGYTAYTTDHKQRLLPGYVSTGTLADLGIEARYKDGTIADPENTKSYVWRLAPYVDHNWQTMFVDYHSREALSSVTSGPELDYARIAEEPSFGINSLFVGGDDVHGPVQKNPWYPANPNDVLAATRQSEVKNPSRLIVFAPSTFSDPTTDVDPGRAFVLPPYTNLDDADPDPQEWTWVGPSQWTLSWQGGEAIIDGDGVPIARWGALMPAAHLDGSVSTREIGAYADDMRLWSPWVTASHKIE
jgi:prepilin-type N-terminal cleavage/methylation domain-containing protein